MFTIFDLFNIVGPILGLVLGIGIGHHHGIFGGHLGAIVGFLLGLAVGRLPWVLTIQCMMRELRAKSNSQLWNELRGEDCLTPQFLLLELRRRREPVEEGFGLVLSMLTSEDHSRRCRGWVAVRSAFPDEAERLSGYDPSAPASAMNEVINRVRLDP